MNNTKVVKKQASVKISDFINNFTSYATIHSYTSTLKDFFNFINKNADTYIRDPRLLENGEKIALLDNYERDIKRYWQSLMKNGSTPRTIISKLAVVRIFLKDNKIHLEDSFWKAMRDRGKGNSVVTDFINPTNEQIAKIVHHADCKGRALILAQTSSGMRIGELCKLKLEDIDFDSTPTMVTVRVENSKTKKPRITFFSSEATEAIKAWMKERSKYLKYYAENMNLTQVVDGVKISITKSVDDDRLFPFSTNSARQNTINPAVRKAGLGEVDNHGQFSRMKLHPHCFRYFFRTKFGNIDVAEQLMGHSGYISQYHTITDKTELKSAYLQHEKNLLIFDRATDESEINRRVEERMQSIESNLENRIIRKLMKNFDGDIQSDKTFQELLHSMTEKDD